MWLTLPFQDRTWSPERNRPGQASPSRSLHRSPHPRRRSALLRLEALEDRLAPATFSVLNLADSGPGSLRQAIVQSDSTPGPNKIDFAPGLSGTITLTSGQLTIANNDVKLVGPGADVIAVSGNNASRVFEVDAVQAAISGLTITSGRVSFFNPGGGGGIYNSGGTLTIADCTISGNTSTGNGDGGGLYNNAGTVMVTGSTLRGNSSAGAGGGIDSIGTLTVTRSTFLDNSSTSSAGGGIASDGTLTVTGSTFKGNSSTGGGGISGSGTLTIVDSTITGNSAGISIGLGGGGILSNGTLTVTGSTISDNSGLEGGGIINLGGTLMITDSTLSGNFSTIDGGGIYNASGISSAGLLAIAGCTLFDNSAGGDGGGIFNDDGGLASADVTIRHNSATSGGGIFNTNGGVLAIVASNISDNEGGNIVT